MGKTCLGDLTIDYDNILFDEDELPEYITVWLGGEPVWYHINHDKDGAFIDHSFKKYYIFQESI